MNSNIRVTPLSAEQAVKEWPVIKSFLEKALPYACGRYDMSHVYERIVSGMLMPLLIWDPEEKVVYAVLGVEGQDYPLKKVFEISLAGGANITEWGHVYPAIKAIAKQMGYEQIDVVGRRGWAKFLPGATSTAVQFTEELGNGEERSEDQDKEPPG